MATSECEEELIPLQRLDNDGDEHPDDDSLDLQSEPRRQDDGVGEGTALQVTTSRWKRVSITVTTMLSYAALNAAISMISPFYPIVLPHLGVNFMQLAGLFLAAGSLILFGFVSMMPSQALFIIFSFLLRAVEGIGNAMFYTASYTLLTHLYLERKGMIVGLAELSFSLGNFFGPPIAGGLVEAGGFKLPFLVVGGCMLVLMLLLALLLHRTDLECSNATLPWRVLLNLFSNIMFILLAVCLVTSCSAIMAVIAYFGFFLHQQFDLRPVIIGCSYLSGISAYSLGTIFIGLLTDRLKIPRYFIIAGLVIGFAGCVLVGPPEFLTTPKLWLSILGWAVIGIGTAFAIVPIYTDMYGIAKTVHDHEADVASTLSGIQVAGISAGECLGPIIGGALVYKMGFPSMAAIFGLILLLCALVLVTATVIQRILNIVETGIETTIVLLVAMQ